MKRVYVIPPNRTAHTTFSGKKCSKRRIVDCVSVILLVVSICLAAAGVIAQERLTPSLASLDPGPRPGFMPSGDPAFPNNPGNPIQGLTAQLAFFLNGQSQFQQTDGVAVTSPDNGGLGPAFNSDSCTSCHSQPTTGGTSPRADVGPAFKQNPQLTAGQVAGGTNSIPFFVTLGGPVREARFKSDGGVHDLFTIQGRTDTPNFSTTNPNNCTLAQPNFDAEAAAGNLSLRIPTPVFGAGLIENIGEATLTANLAASSTAALGIHGTFNRSGNDGSLTRFGWKAQNKSLLMFAAEAYNVEMGITNELFPNERGYPPNPLPPGCLVNQTPEDRTLYEGTPGVPSGAGNVSDIESFAQFMRFLAPPIPACSGNACSQSIQSGSAIFTKIGCANCHTPSLTTDPSDEATGLSQVPANLFSDLALHHMGIRLADGITQGNAGPDQFRTAPLWGLGQRVFFLHDGRTSNLVQAILEHQSFGSEANRVIENFELLQLTDKQNLILFLRSL